MFSDGDGRVVYVGKSRSIRKRVASHFSARTTLGAMADEIESIDFLVTETEAEALIAEQQFIKRHRPILNVKLRDDKSYPYIGISLDEEFPRVYFTRERHRPNRAYFGPYANARRVRETLELLGKLFQYRTCDGAGARAALRRPLPRLLHQALRSALRRLHRRRGVRAQHRRDPALPLRPLPRGRARPDREDGRGRRRPGVRARGAVPRPADRDPSLMERQQVAGEQVGTADLIGVAVEGAEANAQVFQVRDGVLSERQGFYLDNKGEDDLGEVAEQFIAQYYEASPTVPPLVVVGPELAGADRAARRGAERAAGDRRSRSARPSAATSGGCASSPSATPSSRSPRTGCGASAAGASGPRRSRSSPRRSAWTSPPIRIEGYDISNLGPEHTVASMVVFEGGAPKKSDYRRFRIRGVDGASDDFASMDEVLSPAARPLHGAERNAPRTTPSSTRASRPAGPDHDRRRQGPARGRRPGAASR